MKPKVTIGLCVKNSETTIKETLESILNQDFPREQMELIVVDGYSRDKTLSIVKDCLEKTNLKTILFHENKGLGRARQIVVENANGEYIVWVDGDMVFSKNYISRLVEFMERNPNVSIAKGRLSLKILANTLATLENFSRATDKLSGHQYVKSYSKTLGTNGSIYRVKVIRQVGGFDENLKYYCEDWDAEIKMQAKGWLRAVKTDVEYLDYERNGLSMKVLWKKYWLRGYYTHYFLHKRPGLIKHHRIFPPAAFLTGLIGAEKLFKIIHKKIVFLLPFQYLLKSIPWYIGFITSHLNSYEPIAK